MNYLALLLTFALATFVQTNTGFAFGLIVMAIVTLFDLLSIGETAFVISVLSLVNVLAALPGNTHHVSKTSFKYVILGGIPSILGGIVLLDYLSTHNIELLKLILAVSIIFCASLLLLKPTKDKQSRPFTFVLFGMFAGLLGGLFATFGPPIVYLLYRQPWAKEVVKFTLMAIFMTTSLFRACVIIIKGDITNDIWLLAGAGVGCVLGATFLSLMFPLKVSIERLKQGVFVLLVLSSVMLMIPA